MGKMPKRNPKRKRILSLFAALMLALTMASSGAALAAIDEGPGRGNPDIASGSGRCSPGQNTDASTGGLQKCP